MTAVVGYAVDIILGRIRVPVACDDCATVRAHVTHHEAVLLAVHRRLLCTCGGSFFSVNQIGGSGER